MQIAAEVAEVLPRDLIVFPNQEHMLHITVFHTSKPTDPIPDAVSPTGGADLSLPPHQRPAATKARSHSCWCLQFALPTLACARQGIPVHRRT